MRFAQHVYPRASQARIQVENGGWQRAPGWAARLSASVRELHVTGPALRRLTPPVDVHSRAGELTFISTVYLSAATAGHLRLIDFASNWGMLYRDGDAMTAPLYANLFRMFEGLRQAAASRGARFILVYVPRREQVWPPDWQAFHDFWNLDPADFDLDREASRLGAFCEARGIPFVDTTPALRAAARERGLFLAHDTHINEHGQAVVAQAILEFIERHPAHRWVAGDGGS
jgi:hypothetical protein